VIRVEVIACGKDGDDEDKSVDLAAESKYDEKIEVNVTQIEPVATFCSSDKNEDEQALQFLLIAPEVEDPEDGYEAQDNSAEGNGLGDGDS
jgi:COMPASS component SWD1